MAQDVQTVDVGTPDHNGRVVVTVFRELPPDESGAPTRSPDGQPGAYDVRFVFGIPGRDTFREGLLDLETAVKSGDSLLVTSLRSSTFAAIIEDLTTGGNRVAEVAISTNDRGAPVSARFSVAADNFDDAELRAFNLLSPILSLWSFTFDVALEIDGIILIDPSEQGVWGIFGWTGRRKNFDPTLHYDFRFDELARFLSAYRERLNATNVFYQALAFYKVTEGIKRLRAERRRRTKQAGLPILHEPTEEFPTDDEMLAVSDQGTRLLLSPYLGRSFKAVLEDMRGTVRNALAHMDPAKEILDSDKLEDLRVCFRAVPALRYIARGMLQNEVSIRSRGQ